MPHEQKTPFSDISTAPRGSLRSFFGAQTKEDVRRDRIGHARSMAISKFGELLESSKNPNKAILELLKTEEGMEALFVVPDLLTDVDRLTKLAAEEKGKLVNVPATSRLTRVSPEGEAKVILPAEQQRTQAEKLTDAIIEAESSKDKRRAELLIRQLPRDTSGEVSVPDALKLRAAGVKEVGNATVQAITQKQAQLALQASRTSEGVISINDLAVRATGNKTGKTTVDALTPEAAEAALNGRREALGSEDLLNLLLGKAITAGGPKGPSIFEQFRAKGGAKQRPVPEVPLAGESAGAATPQITGPELTEEQINAMTPDQIRELATKVEEGGVFLPVELLVILRAKMEFAPGIAAPAQ